MGSIVLKASGEFGGLGPAAFAVFLALAGCGLVADELWAVEADGAAFYVGAELSVAAADDAAVAGSRRFLLTSWRLLAAAGVSLSRDDFSVLAKV